MVDAVFRYFRSTGASAAFRLTATKISARISTVDRT